MPSGTRKSLKMHDKRIPVAVVFILLSLKQRITRKCKRHISKVVLFEEPIVVCSVRVCMVRVEKLISYVFRIMVACLNEHVEISRYFILTKRNRRTITMVFK